MPPTRAVGLELSRERSTGYGAQIRTPALSRLPRPLGRVLDVGCAGGFGAELMREMGASLITGIELDAGFAAEARTRYDEVLETSVESDLRLSDGSFDTILCYDVLEHLYDPWSVAGRLRKLLKPDGRLHVSVPNARQRQLWMPLGFRGTFAYSGEGLMDVTHTRFFTRRDAIAMLECGGFAVTDVSHPPLTTWKNQIATRLTFGRWREFSVPQWYLLGRRTRAE